MSEKRKVDSFMTEWLKRPRQPCPSTSRPTSQESAIIAVDGAPASVPSSSAAEKDCNSSEMGEEQGADCTVSGN
jgi:hypothetical protein